MTNPLKLTTSSYSSEPESRGRRQCKRYPTYFNVTLTDLAERVPPMPGFITNVSQQGVRVMTPIALPTGQAVKLQIADNELFGDVVSSNAESDYFRTGVRVRPPLGGASVSELLREILVDPVPVDPPVPERPSKLVRTTVSRRRLRYPVGGTLHVQWQDQDGGGGACDAKLENVSVTGVRLQLDELIPVGACVSFDEDATVVVGTASVRYCSLAKGNYDVGLEFSGDSGWRNPPVDRADGWC
jgi:hypothetical protein